MVSPAFIGMATGACWAVLGFWLVARFGEFGPQTLRGATVTALAATGLLQAVGPGMHWATSAAGAAFALLAVATPLLTFAFWSGGVLLRTFAAGHGGMPGGGKRAHARSWRRRN